MSGIDRLVFLKGNFYYSERDGMFYSQGKLVPTNRKNVFILNSDPLLPNPFKYDGVFRDSLKEKQAANGGKLSINGYFQINNKTIYFKHNELLYEGAKFHIEPKTKIK